MLSGATANFIRSPDVAMYRRAGDGGFYYEHKEYHLCPGCLENYYCKSKEICWSCSNKLNNGE